MNKSTRRWPRLHLLVGLLLALSLVAAACGDSDDDSSSSDTTSGDGGSDDGGSDDGGSDDGGSDDGGSADGTTLNVAIVQNPQMEDIVELTPDLYTADSGVTVNYTILPENELREITTRDVATEGDQFDVVMIGLYEAPQFGEAGWLAPITEQAANDADWNQADVFPPILEGLSFGGELYAAPFYAESSFLNYRTDVFEEMGLTMPERPTWAEVDGFAREIEAAGDMSGICLRGVPGWGNQGAA
ncbi:MAG: ABC transporter substrate-binding protein, partial [Acidimicrobiales bacterium]